MPLRILHVVPTLDPAAGGPPMVAYALAAAQSTLRHNASVLSYSGPYLKAGTLQGRPTALAVAAASQRLEDATHAIPGRERILRHDLSPASSIERLIGRRAGSALRSMVSEADVVHLHAIWDPIALRATIEARRQRRPYIVMLNGMLDPWSLAQHPWKKRIALSLAYRRMLNSAAALHVCNELEGQLIERLELDPPLEIVPNGVFLSEIDPLPEKGTFRRLHPELADRAYVLFLSRLHPKKGLDVLAEAFARLAKSLPDLALVVTGPDDGALGPFLRQIHALDIRDRVIVSGPLYGRDKIAAYTGAACYCLPSRQEGFSLAVTEALACGTPVIVSESTHFPEIAAAGAGLTVRLDPAEVARAIEEIVSDERRAHAMGCAGRRLVAARFTWERIAELTLSMYERYA